MNGSGCGNTQVVKMLLTVPGIDVNIQNKVKRGNVTIKIFDAVVTL